MNAIASPLVSCIMPTYNRRKFIPHAINYFLRQDYEHKELIVIDDGTDNIADLIPENKNIRYYRLSKKISLGSKLNLACNYAQGEVLANWDDDDWYAATRLTSQVAALNNDKIEVCGINDLLYYDLQNNSGHRYVYPANQKPWLLGSSLCYTKKLWSKNRFADIDVGMDGLFVWATAPHCVKVLADSTMAVHMIHENNVSPKKTTGKWWRSYPVEELEKIMNDDWKLYKNGVTCIPKKTQANTSAHVVHSTIINKPESLKNIYACLVHDSEECIIDLVRNLHYHDPSSTILLYNGGTNKQLFSGYFPFHKYGAVIHPKPVAVTHGYLHPFALNCMQFALDNFSFDTLTVVDSDQLAIRSGYSCYIKSSISAHTGMLSSKPKKITPHDKTDAQLWPALQALKEYELWKPLLQKFEDGENKFLYWTFWPSTVFTCNAARDLVKLFNSDVQLKKVMEQTKIWATEEVILPTLVRLLGYEIALNPCSYEFVKFRKTFTIDDIKCSFKNTNAYWLHPVTRKYEDSIRKFTRQNFKYYVNEKEQQTQQEAGCNFFSRIALINKIKKIEGWLADEEAELLIETVLDCYKKASGVIVETGSYHGKSTVLFGNLIKTFFPNTKLYAIDAHDGKQGAAHQGLQTFPPSFEKLQQNIKQENIGEYVEVIKSNSWEVKWNKPVAFLLIDGLHDYPDVAKDFYHFADWLETNACIAFHDYADYFPDVKAFVHELLETNQYKKICLVNSLIILQKINDNNNLK